MATGVATAAIDTSRRDGPTFPTGRQGGPTRLERSIQVPEGIKRRWMTPTGPRLDARLSRPRPG